MDTKMKPVKKSFNCPGNAEVCHFEVPMGTNKKGCKDAWEGQESTPITNIVGNPMDNLAFTQVRLSGFHILLRALR